MNCSECGSTSVTTTVNGDSYTSHSLLEIVMQTGVDESVLVQQECIECGWTQERSLVTEHVLETSGDPGVIEENSVTGDIIDALNGIDDVEKLREIKARLAADEEAGDGSQESEPRTLDEYDQPEQPGNVSI